MKPSKPKPPVVVDQAPAVKASIADKKSVVKMDPVKDFGSFSTLMAPALLSGMSVLQFLIHHNLDLRVAYVI